MPSTDRKLELKAKTSVAQTGSQPFVYAKGLMLSAFSLFNLHILTSYSTLKSQLINGLCFSILFVKLQEIIFLNGGLNSNVLVFHKFLCS
jgi:hypothetical protein